MVQAALHASSERTVACAFPDEGGARLVAGAALTHNRRRRRAELSPLGWTAGGPSAVALRGETADHRGLRRRMSRGGERRGKGAVRAKPDTREWLEESESEVNPTNGPARYAIPADKLDEFAVGHGRVAQIPRRRPRRDVAAGPGTRHGGRASPTGPSPATDGTLWLCFLCAHPPCRGARPSP